jgi:CelD/BcsL family acetyltransferase involved in cellulose biosynthesis
MAAEAPLADLRPRLLRPSDVSRHAWRALVAQSRPSDPKLLPEIALEPAGGRTAEPLLFWRGDVASARTLALLEPRVIRLARAPGIGRLTTLRALRVVGNDVYGEVDGASASEFIDAACTLLAGGRADCVVFDDLAANSPLGEPIAAAERARRILAYRPSPPQPHWYIEFPSPAEAYWKGVSSKARYKLRRKARALDHRVITIREPAQVREFLERARHISARSWQGKRLGLRVCASPEELRKAERLAEVGALRSYLLERSDGTPLAFVLGSQWRGRYFHEETGYDMSYAELSPGMVLQYRLLEDLIAQDTPQLLDFGAGDAEYKRSLGNVCGESGRLILVRRTGRPLAAYALAGAWHASDRGARALMRRAGVYERVRRLYRGRR